MWPLRANVGIIIKFVIAMGAHDRHNLVDVVSAGHEEAAIVELLHREQVQLVKRVFSSLRMQHHRLGHHILCQQAAICHLSVQNFRPFSASPLQWSLQVLFELLLCLLVASDMLCIRCKCVESRVLFDNHDEFCLVSERARFVQRLQNGFLPVELRPLVHVVDYDEDSQHEAEDCDEADCNHFLESLRLGRG